MRRPWDCLTCLTRSLALEILPFSKFDNLFNFEQYGAWLKWDTAHRKRYIFHTRPFWPSPT